MPAQKTVIIICGPTASGKTSVAIQLAKHFQTEIISADSRQCYRELKIGVARPSTAELTEVRHHFIASHSIHDEVTASLFEKFALEKTEELFKDHDNVIMEGGTGLYIKAFCEGLDEIPEVNPAIRQKIIDDYAEKGMPWLSEEIHTKDPRFFEEGESKNPRRVMRALEVIVATGRSILDFRKGKKVTRPFRIIKFGLDIPKLDLLRNIDVRVDMMIRQGLVEETRSLMPYRDLPALHTVGYTEIFQFLDGKISIEKATTLIKTHTRQYAKRQMTWFRKDRDVKWMSGEEITNYFVTS